MVDYLKRTWAEVDLDAVTQNIRSVRELLLPQTRLMAVVKADAYGHGDAMMAQHLEAAGIRHFGVSNLIEAQTVRENAPAAELILILGVTPPDLASHLSGQRITQTVYDLEYARALSARAAAAGVTVDIHIKVDTGMGRLGFDSLESPRGAVDEIQQVLALPGLHMTGIFTHFSAADEFQNDSVCYTERQYRAFCEICNILEDEGVDTGIRHCCNSAGIINYPEMHLDMVRLGIVLYGLNPSQEMAGKLRLSPALQLKTVVSMVKQVPQDRQISYGRTYTSDRTRTLATVAIGYADGYPRMLSNRATMLVNGRQAPVTGRVCMDQTILDVSEVGDVREGDTVVVFGASGVTADDIAALCGTVNYEIVCNLARRVPRVYCRGGETVGVYR